MVIFEGNGGKVLLTITQPEAITGSSQDEGRAVTASFFFISAQGRWPGACWSHFVPVSTNLAASAAILGLSRQHPRVFHTLAGQGPRAEAQGPARPAGGQGTPHLLRFVRWSQGRGRCVSACETGGHAGGEGNCGGLCLFLGQELEGRWKQTLQPQFGTTRLRVPWPGQ